MKGFFLLSFLIALSNVVDAVETTEYEITYSKCPVDTVYAWEGNVSITKCKEMCDNDYKCIGFIWPKSGNWFCGKVKKWLSTGKMKNCEYNTFFRKDSAIYYREKPVGLGSHLNTFRDLNMLQCTNKCEDDLLCQMAIWNVNDGVCQTFDSYDTSRNGASYKLHYRRARAPTGYVRHPKQKCIGGGTVIATIDQDIRRPLHCSSECRKHSTCMAFEVTPGGTCKLFSNPQTTVDCTSTAAAFELQVPPGYIVTRRRKFTSPALGTLKTTSYSSCRNECESAFHACVAFTYYDASGECTMHSSLSKTFCSDCDAFELANPGPLVKITIDQNIADEEVVVTRIGVPENYEGKISFIRLNLDGLSPSTSKMTRTFGTVSAGNAIAVLPFNLNAGYLFNVEEEVTASDEKAIEPTQVRASCSCPEFSTSGGSAGAIEVTQSTMSPFIYVKWQDQGRCTSSFAVSVKRAEDQQESVLPLAENYRIYSTCGQIHEPRERVSDNILLRDSAQLGSEWKYCVTAQNVEPHRPSFMGLSVCSAPLRVRFSTRVRILVTVDPTIADLPIEGVFVSWTLGSDGNPQISNQAEQTTDKDGYVTLDIPLDDEMTYSNVLPLNITLSKASGNVDHTFLCHASELVCNTVTKNVRHLEYDYVFRFVDDTVLPLSGKVTIAGTQGNCGLDVTGDNPPRVCLVSRTKEIADLEQRNRLAQVSTSSQVGEEEVLPGVIGSCVEPSADGSFTLPAPLGLEVIPRVVFHNHVFERANDDAFKGYDFVHIQDDGTDYAGFHLVDTTMETLNVEFWTGSCSPALASPFFNSVTLEVNLVHCPFGYSQELHLTSSGSIELPEAFQVPSAKLNVKVKDISTKNGHNALLVESYLKGRYGDAMVQQIDLHNVAQKATVEAHEPDNVVPQSATLSPTPSPTDESNKFYKYAMVHFEYHPLSTITVHWLNRDDSSNSCKNTVSPEGIWQVVLNLEQEKRAQVEIQVSENFDDVASGVYCNVFNGDIKLMNGLGQSSFNQQELQATDSDPGSLGYCSTGCEFPVEYDFEMAQSFIVKEFVLGGPSLVQPLFAKPFRVEIHDEFQANPSVYRANVIIVGHVQADKPDVVPLPQWMPLVVIRDPPGGHSTAFYHSGTTNVDIKTKEFKRYSGYEGEHSLGLGVKGDVKASVGFGVEAETFAVKAESKLSELVEVNSHRLTQHKYHEDSGIISVDWSFETSGEATHAGKQSDVLLVADVSFAFISAWYVGFDHLTCSVIPPGDPETTTIPDEDSMGFSFVTRYHIEENVLKKLTSLVNAPDFNQKTNEEQESLLAAKLGWETVLQQMDDDLQQIFKSSTAGGGKALTNLGNEDPELVPKVAAASNRGWSKGGTETEVDGRLAEEPISLEQMRSKAHRLRFVGGGSQYKFQHNFERSSSENGAHDRESFMETGGGVGFESEMGSVLYYESESKNIFSGDSTTVKLEVKTTSSFESSGFSLGDPDVGDWFELDVKIDPKYGTFAFNTKYGESRCPPEVNTDQREKPIVTADLANPAGPFHPDAPVALKFNLENKGTVPFHTELFVDLASLGDDGLGVKLDGATLVKSRIFEDLQPGSFVPFVLEFTRGTNQYSYDDVVIGARSLCAAPAAEETNGNLAAKNVLTLPTIEFFEQCPGINLVGDIAQTGKLVSNTATGTVASLSIPFENPDAVKWSQHSRVNNVVLEFKKPGDPDWTIATDADGVNIDLVALEMSSGFAVAEWGVQSQLPRDGLYQVRGSVYCYATPHVNFDRRHSEVFTLVVDKSGPLATLKEPSDRKFEYGDEISISWSERINCHRPFTFDVSIRVNAAGSVLSEGNKKLKVICFENVISVVLLDDDLSALHNMPAALIVTGVQDRNGNTASQSVAHTFIFDTLNKCGRISVTSLSDTVVTGLSMNVPDSLDMVTTQEYNTIHAAVESSLQNLWNLDSVLVVSLERILVPVVGFAIEFVIDDDGSRRRLRSETTFNVSRNNSQSQTGTGLRGIPKQSRRSLTSGQQGDLATCLWGEGDVSFPCIAEGGSNGFRVIGLSTGQGATATCVVIENLSNMETRVKCFGLSGNGHIGPSQSASSVADLEPLDLGTGAFPRKVAVSASHACFVMSNGGVKCAGGNSFGQLGNNGGSVGASSSDWGDNLPYVTLPTGSHASDVCVGEDFTCILLNDGAVCFGNNDKGQSGSGGSTSHRSFNGATPVKMSCGRYFVVFLLDNGTIQGFGSNRQERSNWGTDVVLDVKAGKAFSCILTGNGKVKCRGKDAGFGELGGSGDSTKHTVDLGSDFAVGLSVGNLFGCATFTSGAVKCWGKNAFGNLGLEDTENRGDEASEMGNSLAALNFGATRNVLSDSHLRVSAISSYDEYSCAILGTAQGNQLVCWGKDHGNNLGIGVVGNIGDDPNEMGDNLQPIPVV